MKKRFFPIVIILLFFSFITCKYTFLINVIPSDAEVRVDGERIENDKIVSSEKEEIEVTAKKDGYKEFHKREKHEKRILPTTINIRLEELEYKVTIDVIDLSCDAFINGKQFKTPFTLSLKKGEYTVQLKYKKMQQQFKMTVNRDSKYLFRLQEKKIPANQFGIFACGGLPKQTIFTPDDRYVYIPLLDDDGFDIFSMQERKVIRRVTVGEHPELKGYPEGCFVPKYNSFWISQMTTGMIYEYDISDEENPKFKRAIDTKGVWTKIIVYNDKLDLLATSNWASNNVSLIDYKSGKIIKLLKNIPAPRGLAFSKDGQFLYITSFEGGLILKYSTKYWKELKRIYIKNAAMRHIVLANNDTKCFVSDMYHFKVYEITTENFKIVKSYKVYYNPNTIDLSKDERYLFVSCRGPNSTNGYLERSPKNGEIDIIDVQKQKILYSIGGGNQPTGLDVSNNGKFLVFSNFRDKNIEIYNIEK